VVYGELWLLLVIDVVLCLTRLPFICRTQLFGEAGRLQREPFNRLLRHFLKISSDEINQTFYALDKSNRGAIAFEDFYRASETDERMQRLFEPNRNFRQAQKSDSH